MRQIIFNLIAIVACILKASAQDQLSEELLALEQKAFACKSSTEENALLLQKFNCYLKYNAVTGSAALNEMNRIDPALVEAPQRKIFLWNACLVAHLNNDYNSAKNYLNRYLELAADTSVADAVAGILIYNIEDTAKVRTWIQFSLKKDSSVNCLSCVNEVAAYKRKGKKFFSLMSGLIPGMGSILNGNVVKGVVSLVLCATIGGGVYLLAANKLYINAIFTAFPWFGKFYKGQIRLTKKLFGQKEQKRKKALADKCQAQLKIILDKYPLSFK
jgi:hypothetical protein